MSGPVQAGTNDPLRILAIYAEDYPWDVRVSKLLTGFQAHGCEVQLVCRNLKRLPSRETVGTIPCRRVLPPNLSPRLNSALSLPAFFSPVWLRAIEQGIRESRADLVMVRDLPLSPLALKAAERAGLPLLIDFAENHPAMWGSLRASYPELKSARWLKIPAMGRRLERYVAPRAAKMFVVVEEMREHLVACGAHPERIHVVSNTPDLDLFSLATGSGPAPDPATGKGYLDFIYVGFIDRCRGLRQIIEALPYLAAQNPPPRLHIVGDGDFVPDLKSLASSLGLGESVVFHGWLEHRQVPAAIERADVGLIPHLRNEHTDTTIPNKLFDYMACAKPVLVTDARPLARVVAEENCGRSFRDGDRDDLVNQMRAFWDADYRAACGSRGQAAVRRRYHWQPDLLTAVEAVRELGQISRRNRQIR